MPEEIDRDDKYWKQVSRRKPLIQQPVMQMDRMLSEWLKTVADPDPWTRLALQFSKFGRMISVAWSETPGHVIIDEIRNWQRSYHSRGR